MESFLKEFLHLKIEFEDIKSATNNFRDDNVIGRGGFGNVYRGSISHFNGQRAVAIKRLDRRYGQGNTEFWREIMMLSRYTHKNLISLVGFCDEGHEKILLYELASHKSLDRHLSSTFLKWAQRIKICLDAARGLSYLHDDKGTQQRVLHRDIKSSNILLDENWNAKVSDMGLSKIGPANQMHTALITNIVGTMGYLDPLYMETGILSKESDVYSFGVVLFEVLCGRLCYDNNNGQVKIFVRSWKQSYKQDKLVDIIFQDLIQQMDSDSLKTFSDIAFQCLQKSREKRPTMPEVVKNLESALDSHERSKWGEWLIYKEIISTAVPSLNYRSKEELSQLLSQGVLLNGGKTWFSLNDNRIHCVMIPIAECLALEGEDHRFSYDYNSRFASGTYSASREGFKTHVRTKLLSPLTRYTVNLVFKYLHKEYFGKPRYISLAYNVDCRKKYSIVHLGDKREDEWLTAELYQFTTSQSILDLDILFLYNAYWPGLEVEGIEIQPLENVEHQVSEYEEILEAAEPPLIYRSVEELKVLLSKGVRLNEGKTWFSIDDNGKHVEMISVHECWVEKVCPLYDTCVNSRFVNGSYRVSGGKFQTHVHTQFLSPLTKYRVSFVFKIGYTPTVLEQVAVELKYRLRGEKEYLISKLASKREDEWLMFELYEVSCQGINAELLIEFETSTFMFVEGIEFRPAT